MTKTLNLFSSVITYYVQSSFQSWHIYYTVYVHMDRYVKIQINHYLIVLVHLTHVRPITLLISL